MLWSPVVPDFLKIILPSTAIISHLQEYFLLLQKKTNLTLLYQLYILQFLLIFVSECSSELVIQYYFISSLFFSKLLPWFLFIPKNCRKALKLRFSIFATLIKLTFFNVNVSSLKPYKIIYIKNTPQNLHCSTSKN